MSEFDMDRWKQYLFESQSEATLREWARRLSLFRFFRAYGGHANDGDSLDVAYRYETVQDLEDFLGLLGIPLFKYSEKPPRPEPGVSYTSDQFAQFPSLISGTQWVKQPGRSLIADQPVFVWCERSLVTLSVGGGPIVTERDVQAAEAIEKVLAHATLKRVDPPRETQHYICPMFYPEYFS